MGPVRDHGSRPDVAGTVPDRGEESVVARLLIPFGAQTGLSLGLDARGTVTTETYDAAGNLIASETLPLEQTFAMRRVTGDRWLNVGVFPIGTDGPPAAAPAPSR